MVPRGEGWNVLALRGKVWVAGRSGYMGGFCEELPQVSPMSSIANASLRGASPSGIMYLRRGGKRDYGFSLVVVPVSISGRSKLGSTSLFLELPDAP